jgi:hypothetical protein
MNADCTKLNTYLERCERINWRKRRIYLVSLLVSVVRRQCWRPVFTIQVAAVAAAAAVAGERAATNRDSIG